MEDTVHMQLAGVTNGLEPGMGANPCPRLAGQYTLGEIVAQGQFQTAAADGRLPRLAGKHELAAFLGLIHPLEEGGLVEDKTEPAQLFKVAAQLAVAKMEK